jgi:phage terminase large subunit
MQLETEIFPAYRDFLQPARFKVAYGGRGSAKTRTFTTILTNNVLSYGWRVVCFREIMETIADSVYQEFVADIERRGLSQYFDITKTQIACPASGGVVRFSGIKSNQKRLDSQKLKGFSDFDCAWFEEADAVSKESWDSVIPTMRKNGSELWVSYNPKSILDETHKRFVLNRQYPDEKDGKPYCIVRKINYTENPRFPQELRDDMELMKATDYEAYRHVYGGEPVANSDLSVIQPAWISAAIDANIKLGIVPSGRKEGGFDVADDGQDANAIIFRQGIVATYAEEWRDKDPVSAAAHAYAQCQSNGVEYLRYDDIGVGAGAKGQFRLLEQGQLYNLQRGFTRVQTEGFNAGGTVVNPDLDYVVGKSNKDMFYNAKAQAWWLVADRFRNTYNAVNGKPHDANKLISIAANLKGLDKLCAELSQPRRDYLNGKVKVESKADMKKRGVSSPNLADAFIMAYLENGAVSWSVWS